MLYRIQIEKLQQKLISLIKHCWHRDKESRYGTRPVIASISLGQTRNFDFRKKDHHQSKYSLPLPSGSLLFMKGDLQEFWEHRIAKSTIPMKERINLTFRLI
ncbi:alpha-ketoglutarate-dependent dioxygenase AlkB [Chryseobacterium sp.]|uniref:alpha-ketoglutarate-dependent dioxygenase AlkB n=1 Tax=Chryseobacterium sp. TaxID=1871047 RepID=UPI00289DCC06|nr:alpha-ketoglutarate-dependent dioxygenase AlkB [Chryseobacterium sp.]